MRNENLIGQRFGELIVLKKLNRTWNKYSIWECQCDCGNLTTPSTHSLLKKGVINCGKRMGHTENLVGKKFGKLLVKERTKKEGSKFTAWLCKCDCGKDFIAETRGLIHNRTKSCGCDSRLHFEGQKFGRLTVIKECSKRTLNRTVKWECLCDCGERVYPTTWLLKNNKAISCGKCTRNDLINQKFGLLTVIKKIGVMKKGRTAIWLCKCDCGKEAKVSGGCLSNGGTKSCGCLRILFKDRSQPAKKKLFSSYKIHAKKRNLEFKLTFEEFIKLTEQDCFYCGSAPYYRIGEGVKNKTLYIYNGIDRKDNKKGYSIENCVTCCKICNFAKTNKSIESFIKWTHILGINLRKNNYV